MADKFTIWKGSATVQAGHQEEIELIGLAAQVPFDDRTCRHAGYPGPDRSIKLSDLQSGSFISRRYRNRRIGEFLKELNLTEGRGTGIPKILRAMKANDSPAPRFKTYDDRTYFVSYFPAHPLAVSKETAQVTAQIRQFLLQRLK